MDLRIAITDDLNSEREKLSSAIIAPFSKVGLNVGNIDEYTSGEELLRQFSAGRYDEKSRGKCEKVQKNLF